MKNHIVDVFFFSMAPPPFKVTRLGKVNTVHVSVKSVRYLCMCACTSKRDVWMEAWKHGILITYGSSNQQPCSGSISSHARVSPSRLGRRRKILRGECGWVLWLMGGLRCTVCLSDRQTHRHTDGHRRTDWLMEVEEVKGCCLSRP